MTAEKERECKDCNSYNKPLCLDCFNMNFFSELNIKKDDMKSYKELYLKKVDEVVELMMKKSIDLENGFELVVEGDSILLNHEEEILDFISGSGSYRIFVRKKAW